MTERAAHLVDHVFPDVAVRQWVLSLPYRLRYLLAWDHDVCRRVVAVYVRTVLGFRRRRARRAGVRDGRGGAVAIIQRFGAALNLNVHVHALVLDGVFARDVVRSSAMDRLRQRVERKRIEILRAAAAIFRRRGHHGASVDQIARALNMAPGNLYYYFRNKEESRAACG